MAKKQPTKPKAAKGKADHHDIRKQVSVAVRGAMLTATSGVLDSRPADKATDAIMALITPRPTPHAAAVAEAERRVVECAMCSIARDGLPLVPGEIELTMREISALQEACRALASLTTPKTAKKRRKR